MHFIEASRLHQHISYKENKKELLDIREVIVLLNVVWNCSGEEKRVISAKLMKGA